jgi:hypothetical protein
MGLLRPRNPLQGSHHPEHVDHAANLAACNVNYAFGGHASASFERHRVPRFRCWMPRHPPTQRALRTQQQLLVKRPRQLSFILLHTASVTTNDAISTQAPCERASSSPRPTDRLRTHLESLGRKIKTFDCLNLASGEQGVSNEKDAFSSECVFVAARRLAYAHATRPKRREYHNLRAAALAGPPFVPAERRPFRSARAGQEQEAGGSGPWTRRARSPLRPLRRGVPLRQPRLRPLGRSDEVWEAARR